VADSSYLPDVAGGMVAAASFADEGAAESALRILHDSGVRPEDISVLARDPDRAARAAGNGAWYPGKGERGLARVLHRLIGHLPREVRSRYATELEAGRIVIVAAAGGQPSDTLAALFAQAGGRSIEQWWQAPAELFAPPELAGPF
jgi:hypothetical protein